MQGADVLWFIDNTSALSAMIKGSSGVPDSARMAMRASISLTALRCRAWFEHVASAQNPSDVLSREAFADLAVQQLLLSRTWVMLPHRTVNWKRLVNSSLSELWDDIEALGIDAI